ncbi:MAG: pseudouridine synthase [Lachnospiraceae bacterium]|nr:pseudouridine synthase [Lachnospiraceae bacterium]
MILYEDKEILVCHKPAGIPVQSASVREKDMVSILKNHLADKDAPGYTHKESSDCVSNPYGIPRRQMGGDGVSGLYVVHRLDQPVEGVLVFAKTKRAAADLSRQITDGSMKKTYWAVVEISPDVETIPNAEFSDAELPDVELSDMKTLHAKTLYAKSEEQADQHGQQEPGEWHTLVDYLVKNGRNNTSYVSDRRDKAAKRAELQYRILKEWTGENVSKLQENRVSGVSKTSDDLAVSGESETSDYPAKKTLALAEINLKTGRHHQIRVQMAHAGMPLVGDRKYNPQCDRQSNGQTTLALCAVSLTFRHPTTKKIETFTVRPSAEIFNSFFEKTTI